MRRVERRDLVAPAAILDLELSEVEGGADVLDVTRYRSLWCLTRRQGLPVGISFWSVAHDHHIKLVELTEDYGKPWPSPGPPDPDQVGDPPMLTISICTHDRPVEIRQALISLQKQSDTDFEVLVVDNAPSSDSTRRAVAGLNLPRCRYVVEPIKGLSRARNRGLEESRTEWIAWIDDDEIADVNWVRRLKEGMLHSSAPSAVCGLMLPAELETEAQVRFEQYGGFNKGRGVEPEVLYQGPLSVSEPLYPLPGFGAGGNMAFRVESLLRIGGFDCYLGAGTRTHGGEETVALVTLLRTGKTVLHWPSALTWHFHRRDMEALEAQMFGFSAGLSAFYASMIRAHPAVLFRIMTGVVPKLARDALVPSASLRTGGLPDDFPKALLSASRHGFLKGAVLYFREIWSNRSDRRT